MATWQQVGQLASEIAIINNNLRGVLTSPSGRDYLENNAAGLTTLNDQCSGLLSRSVILLEMKDIFETDGIVDVLPSDADLTNKPDDWLAIGDNFNGFTSAFAGVPRQVNGNTSYYTYFYRHQPTRTYPRRTPSDPWLLNYTYAKLTATDVDGSYSEHAAEKSAVNAVYLYYEQKQYLP